MQPRRVRRIARQIADQPVVQRQAEFFRARAQHFDLHPRHVDAGRTFAPARLAGDAEFERLGHVVGGQRIRPKLAGDGKPQRIGAAARHVALVKGDAVTRAHDAACKCAAGAVVVAHLDRALEAAAGSGIGRPVERGLHLIGAIVRAVAEIRAVIEFRRAHDLAGIEQVLRIEAVLHLLRRRAPVRAPNIFS